LNRTSLNKLRRSARRAASPPRLPAPVPVPRLPAHRRTFPRPLACSPGRPVPRGASNGGNAAESAPPYPSPARRGTGTARRRTPRCPCLLPLPAHRFKSRHGFPAHAGPLFPPGTEPRRRARRVAAASSRPGRLGTKPAFSPRSLALATGHRRAAPPQSRPTTLDPLLQRRPPPATAEHPTAGRLHPQIRCKSNPSTPLTILRPFPGPERSWPRRNWRARAGRPPQGPNCKGENLIEGLFARR
jgi:hypothetical protein